MAENRKKPTKSSGKAKKIAIKARRAARQSKKAAARQSEEPPSYQPQH